MLLGFFSSPPLALFNLQMALNEPTISTANTETFLQESLSRQLISKMENYEGLYVLTLIM